MFDLQFAMLNSMTEMARSFTDACAIPIDGPATESRQVASSPDAEVSIGTNPDAGSSSERTSAFALPEVPSAGSSWYKAPYENPVLTFWDDMLKPWRTFTPTAASTALPFAQSSALFGASATMPQFAGLPQFSGFSQSPCPAQAASIPQFNSPQTAGVNDSVNKTIADWSSVWQAFITPAIERDAGITADPVTRTGIATEDDTTADAVAEGWVAEGWKSLIAFHSDNGMAMARAFFPDHTVMTMQVPVPTMPFVPAAGMPRS